MASYTVAERVVGWVDGWENKWGMDSVKHS